MFNRSKSYLKTLAILLCSFIFALTMPIPIHALTNAQWDFFNANGIYYYDPQGGGFTGCYVGDITVQGSTAAEKIWTGLTTFLTDEQAAGVMGNMVSESGFNPVRHEMSKLNEYKSYCVTKKIRLSAKYKAVFNHINSYCDTKNMIK